MRTARYVVLLVLVCSLSWLVIDRLWSQAGATTDRVAARSKAPERPSMQELHRSLLNGDTQVVERELDNLAKELPRSSRDWNHENVVHHYMILRGLFALMQDDNVKAAKDLLLLAGRVEGSPQLNSFGPNMLLAKELLERGEFEVVELYLNQCEKFWPLGAATIDRWRSQIRDRKIPDFGANLDY